MKKGIKILINLLTVLSLSAPLFSAKGESSPAGGAFHSFDGNFYKAFIMTPVIRRDALFNEYLNKILQGRCYIEAVDAHERYNRKFRITAIDSQAINLNIKFYIFTDKEEYLNLLNKGDLFEFKGQFVIFTPLNTRGDSFIFDIILEDGALVIE